MTQTAARSARSDAGTIGLPDGSTLPSTGATRPSAGATLPSVSVIVPCYNYGHFLEGCLRSVLTQEGVAVSVLVIDDCSTDGSVDIGRRLAQQDDRIEFRAHRENMGLIPTANAGLRWARGDYVVLLSADDLLVPGCLYRATAVMARHANVGLVYGRSLFAREARPLPEFAGKWRGTKVWSGADWIRLRCRSGHSCISSPEAVVRNSIQRAVGGYDQACLHTSDLNMWLRIAAVADVAHIRGVPQAIYRIHAGSMLRSREGPMIDLRERREAFDSFFAACASKLAEPDRFRALAARTLARQALWRASRQVDSGGEEDLVRELTDFALDVYPDTRHLREWRGLRLRRWIGAGRSLLFPPFIITGAAHRLRHHANWKRLRFRGI
jgi:Glycosyl transferase family 2